MRKVKSVPGSSADGESAKAALLDCKGTRQGMRNAEIKLIEARDGQRNLYVDSHSTLNGGRKDQRQEGTAGSF
jgi:hypothetical protein